MSRWMHFTFVLFVFCLKATSSTVETQRHLLNGTQENPHPWLSRNGGSTKLNGSPHKYSIKILMHYLHTITSGPWYCVNISLKVCSSPADLCSSSALPLLYSINIAQSAWPWDHNVSLGIKVTGMILCSSWCEWGVKGAMKDQIINSGGQPNKSYSDKLFSICRQMNALPPHITGNTIATPWNISNSLLSILLPCWVISICMCIMDSKLVHTCLAQFEEYWNLISAL